MPTAEPLTPALSPPPRKGEGDAPHGWAAVCDDNLPPLDEIVWLWDGQRIWIGGRADDCDGWLWGNTYGTVWHNGAKWEGDLETDEEYKPTHWMPMPDPPSGDDKRPNS